MKKITTKTGGKESLFAIHEHKQNPLSHSHTCSKKGNSMRVDSSIKPAYYLLGTLVAVMLSTGTFLVSSRVNADNNTVVDNVSIEVPVSCSMTGTITTGQEHTATLAPGTYSGASGSGYENGIGKTTLAAHCNDYNGFSIYAIGFTGETEGDNTLAGTSASGSATIPTKVYESTDTTSNWSMKVTKVTDSSTTFNPANMTITNSFDSWHTVPDDYTKVAEYHASTGSSATDQSLGAKVETTYASYISTSQPADTYTGKVKYVMVHPYNATAPVIEVPGIYTLSRADSGESATQIGEPIPNDTATYDSPAEAMDAWVQVWSQSRYLFYLKHTVVNDIITESYIGFTITPEIVAEFEGMIPGDYTLRSGIDESSLQDKPIFTANMNLLKRVYDYANHPERCDGNEGEGYFSCSVGSSSSFPPSLSINTDGYNSADIGGMHCNIDSTGWSSCEWQ